MANTTNFGWETPDDTDLVKDGAAAIRTLGSAIDTSLVDLKGGTTGQVLSKNSNTDMDFTWSSVDPLTILDAKGDLISATAADTPARLASSGVNGDVLTVDTSTATGLKWGAVAAGSMTLISRQTPSAASSLSFGSIPGTYTDLLMRWTGLYVSNNTTGFDVRLNNDSATNYLTFYFYESGVGTGNDDRIFVNRFMNRNNNTTDFRLNAKGWMKVSNYANTSYRKQIDAVSFFNDSAAGNMAYHGSNIYNSNSAITSIDIYRNSGTGTFSTISGGYIELWGVK